jgi:hypothetical protein
MRWSSANPTACSHENALYVGWRTEAALQRADDAGMLYTIAVVLIVLWLLGLVSSYTIGGFIHVLLVIAIVVILLRVISGRKPI